MSLLPFALIFVIMYFLDLRPQQKKVKDRRRTRRKHPPWRHGRDVGRPRRQGERQVVDDDQIEFEISDGVRVRQTRQMISGVRAKGELVRSYAKELLKDVPRRS